MGQIPSTVAQDALPWARILRLSHRMRSQGPGVDFHGYLLKDFVATPGRRTSWRRLGAGGGEFLTPPRRAAVRVRKLGGADDGAFFAATDAPPTRLCACRKVTGGGRQLAHFWGESTGRGWVRLVDSPM